jgi:hypothetical protein
MDAASWIFFIEANSTNQENGSYKPAVQSVIDLR